ncbi:MAG: HAMP domain-containing histidine kinase [Bacilli bacterium]|nr:HAMP domain-containing histidine kinase [Bacilli bacterium]
MNNVEINKLKSRIAFIAVLKIIFFSLLSMFIAVIFIDGVFQDFLANLVNDYSNLLYIYFKANKVLFMGVFFLIIFCVSSFFVIRSTVNSLALLIKSMDKIISNPEEEISLPNELNILERRLNNIRVDLITSKNNEKEANVKKNDLIMYMAHDLKTPLTSVIGYLSLLKNEDNVSKDFRDKYLGIALDKAYRLEELTNQFFEITRYNLKEMPIVKNKLDLSILLGQLVDECFPISVEKNIDIVLNAESIVFSGDGDKLARAFTNLLKNAISYSYEGSKITIDLSTDSDSIFVKFRNKGDLIPDYKLDKIFDKFYRADESRNSKTGGTGLGLAITKDIISLHGGSISVRNHGEYIEFLVILPIDKKAIL